MKIHCRYHPSRPRIVNFHTFFKGFWLSKKTHWLRRERVKLYTLLNKDLENHNLFIGPYTHWPNKGVKTPPTPLWGYTSQIVLSTDNQINNAIKNRAFNGQRVKYSLPSFKRIGRERIKTTQFSVSLLSQNLRSYESKKM